MNTLRLLLIGILGLVCSRPAAAQPRISSQVYASGFTLPIAFVQDPDDRSVQFVVEQTGRIRVVRNGILLQTDFLDLSGAISAGGERGLLGMAFAAETPNNRFFVNFRAPSTRRFYVNFTNPDGHTVIARFRRTSNPLIADASSRFDFRWGGAENLPFILQPFSNHNGGHLAFGPDGYLYIGLGDGGDGNDPEHRAQNPQELLGKMLRIDVNVPDSHPNGYQIPPGNPFTSGNSLNARPEIWSFGLRNPWRYSFDDPALGGTGALLLGDVGQDRWEEINYEPPSRGGRNYGWRNREGLHDNFTSLDPAFSPLTDPILEYDRSVGQTVTGGYVYRGPALGAPYRGRYFFADFVRGRVWSIGLFISPNGEAQLSSLIEHTQELGGPALGNVSSFGVDAAGELYIVSYSTGTIRKVVGLSILNRFYR